MTGDFNLQAVTRDFHYISVQEMAVSIAELLVVTVLHKTDFTRKQEGLDTANQARNLVSEEYTQFCSS